MRLDVAGLRVAYAGHEVLSGISLAVAEGGWLCLIGPNGSGKTTLLRAIAGLVDFGGEVRLDGEPLDTARRRRLARLIAYVPQRPTLPAAMIVCDYVALGRTPYIALFGTEDRRDRAVVASVLARLGLDALGDRELGSLSGGEAQRAVLGRALAQQAPLLLLDEPTAALDIGHGQRVLELVDELRDERRLTVVSAMHDLTLAGEFSDRLAQGPTRGCDAAPPGRLGSRDPDDLKHVRDDDLGMRRAGEHDDLGAPARGPGRRAPAFGAHKPLRSRLVPGVPGTRRRAGGAHVSRTPVRSHRPVRSRHSRPLSSQG